MANLTGITHPDAFYVALIRWAIASDHHEQAEAEYAAALRRAPCPDCGADVAAAHYESCDIARCLVTGGQRLMCREFRTLGARHDCGHDRWTGE